MSLRHLWAFLAVALPVLAALLAALPATDLAYHLRAGAEILDSGRIPIEDTWTFTVNGLPWTDQQWGAQVTLALVYRVGGWVGLVVLRAALVGLIFGALFETCRRQGIGLRMASWLTIGAFIVAAPALALRPQLLGMALFALTLVLIFDRHEHPRRLWLVPVIAVVWANVHGSFFLAPAMLGLAWLGDLDRTDPKRHLALAVAIATALATCLTPFGPAVWVYAVALGSNPEVTSRITEWQPASLRDPAGVVFFGSALLVAAFLARRDRPVPWPTLAWLAFFFVLGVYAARGIAWWSLAVVPAVAGLLSAARHDLSAAIVPRPEPSALRRANAAVAVILVVIGIVLVPFWRPVDNDFGAPVGVLSQAPPGITGELRRLARPDGRLFNEQRWGSWFELSLPDLPVAIDSRIEFFPADVWDAYERIRSGRPGWEATLDEWGATIVAVDEEPNSPFVRRLESTGWSQRFTGSEGTILTRAARQ